MCFRDNAPHAFNKSRLSWLDNAMIIEITKNITNAIKVTLPNLQVIPVVGNHDYFPKNQLPGEGSEVYDAFLEMWSDWIPDPEARLTFKRGIQVSRISIYIKYFKINSKLFSATLFVVPQ